MLPLETRVNAAISNVVQGSHYQNLVLTPKARIELIRDLTDEVMGQVAFGEGVEA